jgi:putative transposase
MVNCRPARHPMALSFARASFMPRRARLELAGVPLHVTQRGVNRGAIFVDDDDRGHYLQLLAEVAESGLVAIHAYVLMGNHVHLLMSAAEAGVISAAMRRLGQCYVQGFNRRHRRSGPLWEGRFKSCLVDSDSYVLAVYRYIELNPVRAAMVDAPQRYRWSSVHGNLASVVDPLLTPHLCLAALGAESGDRADAYREWLRAGTDTQELTAIRHHLEQERALGSVRFQRMVEQTLGRPVALRPRGRPERSDR